MNIKQFYFLLLLMLLSMPYANAQLRVLSATGTITNFSESTTNIGQTLVGGTLSIEYPVKSITLRGDVTYVSSNETDTSTPTLDYFFGYRGYAGYVIGNGNRIQVPLLIGYGLYRSEGDLALNRSGFSGHAGLRYYLSSNLAIAGNIKYDRLQNINGQAPNALQLSIGLAYSYGQ